MAKAAPSSSASHSYDVARPHGTCQVSGRAIPPGERLMAALRETPDGFERVDVAIECWDQFDRTGVLAFWKTRMPEREEKKKLFVDDVVLCELFERLADTDVPAKLNFRFVLGLILMRKRMLVYESSRTEGDREFWVVRMKGKDETLDLLDPKLDEQQVLEVSEQLSQILNEEL